LVEELDNKYIDNELNDVKSLNESETPIKKTQNIKQNTKSKTETKPSKTRSKSKKAKTTTEMKEELETKEIKSETNESIISLRKEKVVEYDEPEYILKEITIEGKQILIGPTRLTRFEKARITGARSLQISFGAPLMIKADVTSRSSISLAIEELEKKALPISIRRILPNGLYQDVPVEWLKT
jgi:DNA-directed RNA polymerases I, II, and III subunit RPABC2